MNLGMAGRIGVHQAARKRKEGCSGHRVFKKQIKFTLAQCSWDPGKRVESGGVKDGEAVQRTGVCSEGPDHRAGAVLAWRVGGPAVSGRRVWRTMFHRHVEKQALGKKQEQRFIQKRRFAYGALLELAQIALHHHNNTTHSELTHNCHIILLGWRGRKQGEL